MFLLLCCVHGRAVDTPYFFVPARANLAFISIYIAKWRYRHGKCLIRVDDRPGNSEFSFIPCLLSGGAHTFISPPPQVLLPISYQGASIRQCAQRALTQSSIRNSVWHVPHRRYIAPNASYIISPGATAGWNLNTEPPVLRRRAVGLLACERKGTRRKFQRKVLDLKLSEARLVLALSLPARAARRSFILFLHFLADCERKMHERDRVAARSACVHPVSLRFSIIFIRYSSARNICLSSTFMF